MPEDKDRIGMAREADMTAEQQILWRTIVLASLVGCTLFFGIALYRSGWSHDLLVPALCLSAAVIASLVVFGFFDEDAKR